MYFVYVLRSVEYGNRYVGSTDSVEKRLKEHNSGRSRYTASRKPWVLVYQESLSTRTEAIKRELFLKSGQGRKWLDENLAS
jgi:putative endonuclease